LQYRYFFRVIELAVILKLVYNVLIVLEEAEEFTKQLPTLMSGLVATSAKLTWNQLEGLLRYRLPQLFEYLVNLLWLKPRELGSVKIAPEG